MSSVILIKHRLRWRIFFRGGGGPNFASPPGRFITNDNSNYDKTFHQDCRIIIFYVFYMNLMNLYNIRFPFNPPQPPRTEDLQGAGGSGPSGENSNCLRCFTDNNPRTSWKHGYSLDPLEHFSGSVHYHAVFFSIWKQKLSWRLNTYKSKVILNSNILMAYM